MSKSLRHVAIGCLIAIATVGCDNADSRQPVVRPLRAMRIGDAAGFSGQPIPGQAQAAREVNLSFRVSGPLISLPVNVGDKVTRGDVLARIDPRDFEVRVRRDEGQLARAEAELQAMEAGARPEEIEQLKAAFKTAQSALTRWHSEYERVMDLQRQNAAQRIEIDRVTESKSRAEADMRTAREDLRIGEQGARAEDILAKKADLRSLSAALKAANDEVTDTYLTAPFSGTIAATYVDNHQTVRLHESIVRLLDTSKIEMRIDVPANKISLVPYVRDIVCRFDAFPDLAIPAEVREIGTEASRATRTYPVTLIMDQPREGRILPGMAGVARAGGVDLPGVVAEKGFEVPESAVFSGEDGQVYVWIVDESRSTVHRQAVTPGVLTPRGLHITGVEPGNLMATAGVHSLSEGEAVRIPDEFRQEAAP